MTNKHDRSGELHQLTIGVPLAANDILRALAVTQSTTRQGLVEPLVEEFAMIHAPVVISGLNALVAEIEYGTDFPQDDLVRQIEEVHAAKSDEFPLLAIEPGTPRINTGIRISTTARTIFRTIAIIEGHTRVGPQIEPLVNGYAHTQAGKAADDIAHYADHLRQI